MGCDIHGHVEVKPYDFSNSWYSVINAGVILDRDYDLFGLLAGVRNYVQAEPIAERRGEPSNMSKAVRQELYEFWGCDAHSTTWMTLNEILMYDDSQEFQDTRLYKVAEDGEVLGKAGGIYMDGKHLTVGDTYKQGERVIKLENRPVLAKDILDESKQWQELVRMMKSVGRLYGEENVRLVIWFDN